MSDLTGGGKHEIEVVRLDSSQDSLILTPVKRSISVEGDGVDGSTEAIKQQFLRY